MATELTPQSNTPLVDLTGLPEPVAQAIRQLVQTLRAQHTTLPNGGESTGPDEAGERPRLTGRPAHPEPATPLEGAEGVAGPFPMFISNPQLTLEEFRQKLDEMASLGTGKVLPPDFSRADIYDDHD